MGRGCVSLMQSLVRHHRVGRSSHPLCVMIAEVVPRDETALAGLVTNADGGQGEAKRDNSIRHLPGPVTKCLTGKGGKLNTSQVEPVAASSWAVGQFLSISCEAFR